MRRRGNKRVRERLERKRWSFLHKNGSAFVRGGEISLPFQTLRNGSTLPWYIRAWCSFLHQTRSSFILGYLQANELLLQKVPFLINQSACVFALYYVRRALSSSWNNRTLWDTKYLWPDLSTLKEANYCGSRAAVTYIVTTYTCFMYLFTSMFTTEI